MTEETKEKLQLINKGKKLSEETRKKISEALKGKPCFWSRGENNKNWKGGVTKLNAYFKMGEEYKKWREEVLKRDNYTCQKCGVRGGKLQVHHILNFADYPELRISMENGQK